MSAEVVTSYRVLFGLRTLSAPPAPDFKRRGFTVADVSGGATHALDASFGTNEDDAAVKIHAALADIDHDPLIEYQVASLEFFGG